MRDATAYQMHEANARRNALILGQFEFLQTRQEALERVWRAAKWYDRLFWVMEPRAMFRIADAVQLKLLADRRKAIEEAARKPKILVPTHG